MAADRLAYGLLAEFATPEAVLEAARRARAAGYRRMDAYTPFPVKGLAEAIGFREARVPRLTLIGGVFGAALAFFMQVYVSLDYPLNVGGRPLVPVPAFLVVTFELTILFAVLFSVGSMLFFNGLPRLHHPLFEAAPFQLESMDRFFLCIESADARFDRQQTAAFLRSLGPLSISEVPG